MAGRGRAPKEPEKRRNRTLPSRGEWVEIPAVNGKRAPALPAAPRGGWSAGVRLAWKAWWADGASTQWSPADRESVRQLAYLLHDLERGKVSVAGEVRLRMDSLGLTQKGKRDLRWRIGVEAPEGEVPVQRPSRRDHLRVVGA